MKKQLCFSVFLFALIWAMPVFAQKNDNAKPNFSGTWVLDASKNSNLGFAVLKVNSKSANSVKKMTNQLVIEHTEPEIKLIQSIVAEELDAKGNSLQKKELPFPIDVFYTDKRGEKNKTENNEFKISNTKWDGNSVVVTYVNKNNENISSTRFSLSKDGQELKVWTRMFQFQESAGGSSLSFALSAFGNGEKIFKKKQ